MESFASVERSGERYVHKFLRYDNWVTHTYNEGSAQCLSQPRSKRDHQALNIGIMRSNEILYGNAWLYSAREAFFLWLLSRQKVDRLLLWSSARSTTLLFMIVNKSLKWHDIFSLIVLVTQTHKLKTTSVTLVKVRKESTLLASRFRTSRRIKRESQNHQHLTNLIITFKVRPNPYTTITALQQNNLVNT